ncbi:DcrB-related protein [Telmatospirillum sp.]|uniref:DcrB-related protein n=1 Tax=Telmatospirillum sp. TaxID=2079197 RepID=UPI002851C3C5|nr:DcrB-related protein [Telmatospirillum sp.]MDR3435272.1 DcrB-related protein [Telmatospirillum sp.]
MPQVCQNKDFSFHVPEDWVDRSMVAWSAPPGPGKQIVPNVMVAYDRPRVEETLGIYVNRQLKDLMARAQKFHLETRRDVMLAGRPAVELLFQWDSGTGAIKQRQIYSLLPDGRSITIVNTARTQEFPAVDAKFLDMLNSFGWAPPEPVAG